MIRAGNAKHNRPAARIMPKDQKPKQRDPHAQNQ